MTTDVDFDVEERRTLLIINGFRPRFTAAQTSSIFKYIFPEKVAELKWMANDLPRKLEEAYARLIELDRYVYQRTLSQDREEVEKYNQALIFDVMRAQEQLGLEDHEYAPERGPGMKAPLSFYGYNI